MTDTRLPLLYPAPLLYPGDRIRVLEDWEMPAMIAAGRYAMIREKGRSGTVTRLASGPSYEIPEVLARLDGLENSRTYIYRRSEVAVIEDGGA